MIVETYSNTKVIMELVKAHGEQIKNHENKIIKLEEDSTELHRRLQKVESYQLLNNELIEDGHKAIKVYTYVKKNIIKVSLLVFTIPALLYTLFILWFIDPTAIDVKPIRHVAEYVIDPSVNGWSKSNISHNTESENLKGK